MGAQVAFRELAVRPSTAAQPVLGALARPRITACVLLAADIFAIFLSRVLAGACWRWLRPLTAQAGLFSFLQSLGLFVLTYAAAGLYSSGGTSAVVELRRVVQATGLACLLLMASSFAGPQLESPGLFVLSGCFAAAAVPPIRSITREVFASRSWWGVPVIVLGAGRAAKILIERLGKQPEVGFKPIACFDDDERNQGECA